MRTSRESLTLSLIASAPIGSSTWLLHLRWFAVVGQLITILAAGTLTDAALPYLPLLALVAMTAVTNVVYGWWLHRRKFEDERLAEHPSLQPQPDVASRWSLRDSSDESTASQGVALTLMLLDLVTLTAMLYFSGGAGNPFSFFYFVNLAVGGVMIRPGAAWSLTATAIIGYTFLLNDSVPVDGLDFYRPRGIDLQSGGLLLAFATCSSVVTYFVTRTAGQLKQRERQLLHTQAAQAASQRLEGLTTLAAGAAHELATPLSTIDVIVRELSRHLEDCEKPSTVDTDLKLIDQQLEMCRQILQRMRSAAGDAIAQRWDRTTVGDLIDATLEGIRDPHRVDVTDSAQVESQPLWVPQEAVAQAVRNLIHNGLDASGEHGRVRLESSLIPDPPDAALGPKKGRVLSSRRGDHGRLPGVLQLRVIDSGQGMTEEVLGRAPDPFFTTKEPGRGIGLGLFLTRNVISQLGGGLEFRSTPGRGTEAIVTIPLGTSEDFGNGSPSQTASTRSSSSNESA